MCDERPARQATLHARRLLPDDCLIKKMLPQTVNCIGGIAEQCRNGLHPIQTGRISKHLWESKDTSRYASKYLKCHAICTVYICSERSEGHRVAVDKWKLYAVFFGFAWSHWFWQFVALSGFPNHAPRWFTSYNGSVGRRQVLCHRHLPLHEASQLVGWYEAPWNDLQDGSGRNRYATPGGGIRSLSLTLFIFIHL